MATATAFDPVQDNALAAEPKIEEQRIEKTPPDEVREEPLLDRVRSEVSHLITEDDEPVDNIFSEKQQRLLVEPLQSSWRPEITFVALANVGLFHALRQPPVVPDMLLSLDVQLPDELWEKHHRSYFIWEYGKPPDAVVEVVSNTEGGEADRKWRHYARIGITYYAIFDPQHFIQDEVLQLYELVGGRYILKPSPFLEQVGLGLTVWEGAFEQRWDHWLRWCDQDGAVIPTGYESMQRERQRAEQEHQRAEQEQQRAEQEHQRAERLAKRLRAMGIDPETEQNGA
jgi:hypothetical protein